ncbi:unnamed protein product [Arabidopsis halleri]
MPLCHSHKTIPIAHLWCGLLQIFGILTVRYFTIFVKRAQNQELTSASDDIF